MELEEILANYCHSNPEYKNINQDLVYRKDRPLYEYVLECFRAFEAIPYIKIIEWEHVTDESKFDTDVVIEKHLKDKKKNFIKKFVNTEVSRYTMLKVTFQINFKGEEKIVKRKLLLPKQQGYYFILNGNKFYPIYQLLDRSTYSNKNTVRLRSLGSPISVIRYVGELKNISTQEDFKVPYYKLYLFDKTINPLLYYLPVMGLKDLLLYMDMKNVIKVTDKPIKDEEYYCFKCTDEIYISAIKYFFENDHFTQAMVKMLEDLMNDKKITFNDINDKSYWKIRLGSYFTKPENAEEKAKSILFSFVRLTDKITKDNLDVDYKNKNETHAIIRWMLRNFSELKMKDNLDIRNKRIRINEYIGQYIAIRFNTKINRLLNDKKPTMKGLIDLLNINPNDLIKSMFPKKKRGSDKSETPLLRYDNSVNDLDFFTALKFSTKGPGAMGESASRSPLMRALHESHFGVIDINDISSSDPGMTGSFVPFAKTYNGKFTKEMEPQIWDHNFEILCKTYFGNKYDDTRLIPLQLIETAEKISTKKTKELFKTMKSVSSFINNDMIETNTVTVIDLNTSDKDNINVMRVKKQMFKKRMFTKRDK